MSKLIALVTVLAVVDGVRQEFPAGSELPELPEHDVQQLKRMKAVQDVAETAAADKATAKADAKAGADFERERKAIKESIASTQPDEPATTPAAKKR